MEKKDITALKIRARHLCFLLQSAGFSSRYRGRGTEYFASREHIPFVDDARFLDHKATAKTGRLFQKEYIRESTVNALILVDASKSTSNMAGTILQTALLLFFSLSSLNANICFVVFSSSTQRPIYCDSASSSLAIFLSTMQKAREDKKKGTDLKGAMRMAAKIAREKSMIFLISDFMTELCLKDFSAFCVHHDFIMLHITDDTIQKLFGFASFSFRDAESGDLQVIDTRSKEEMKLWQNKTFQKTLSLKNICKKYGAGLVEIKNNTDPLPPLCHYFDDMRN